MKHAPHITLVAAVSIDGKIARDAKHFPDWTSPEDKKHLHDIEDRSDVMIVGRTTFETARKPLSKRNCIVFTRSVEKAEKKNSLCTFLNPGAVDMIAFCEEHGYTKICLLGGAQTYNYFLERDLIDEIYLTIEPVILGEGLNLFSQAQEPAKQFTLVSTEKLNSTGTILLHYKK